MNRPSSERMRWLVVMAFAVAMAWMESATVLYLRTVVDRVVPYQADPLPAHPVLGPVELAREAATLVMLLTAGMLAGRTWPLRLGYAAVAFGTWDIMYYVFLRLTSGWPSSVFDWDILFLVPLPWWGPVLAPVCIAFLMIAWGTLATQWRESAPARARASATWLMSGVGMALALFVFMADALRAIPDGPDAVRQVLPTRFNWPLFCVALVLTSAPVVQSVCRMTSRRGERAAAEQAEADAAARTISGDRTAQARL